MKAEAVSVETSLQKGKRSLEASKRPAEAKLADELDRLKRMVSMGYEVEVKWLPGTPMHRHGRRLAEEVKGDTILIYAEDEEEALELVRHGFAEWLLNQHTRKYRMLINKMIELFEEIQYQEKEKLIEAITKLITNQTKP
jgi:hypothetical protein